MQPGRSGSSTADFAFLRGISKSFGGVAALRGVSVNLRPAEIHGLVGENGCGKSTLIKILAGVHAPDAGEIGIGEVIRRRLRPAEAVRLGIQVIFQDFSLFPNLSVAENIALPVHLERRRRFVNRRDAACIARRALENLGAEFDLDEPVAGLSVAGQQLVAIARALPHAVRLLVMDEPTAALTHREVERLYGIVRALRDSGVGILLVSHKIPEILGMADVITVLRNGQVTKAGTREEFDADSLVEAMTGRPPLARAIRRADLPARRTPRLRVERLSCAGRLDEVTFDVQPGEIVGMAGRLGSGRTDVARALFGLLPIDGGGVEVDGTRLAVKHPRAAIRAGIAYVPEDRLREGLFPSQSVSRNLVAGALPTMGGRWGHVRPRELQATSVEWIRRLTIATTGPNAAVETLSGGNQQKVVLARWLACSTKVLILNRPTAGVDVAAKAEIHRRLEEWAGRGLSVLLISDDLPELLGLSRRLLVFHEGRVVAEQAIEGVDLESLTRQLEGLS
jgi:simple sugar transport system ATP-binding protein